MKIVTVVMSDEQHKKFVEAAKISGLRRDAMALNGINKEVEIILNKNKK